MVCLRMFWARVIGCRGCPVYLRRGDHSVPWRGFSVGVIYYTYTIYLYLYYIFIPYTYTYNIYLYYILILYTYTYDKSRDFWRLSERAKWASTDGVRFPEEMRNQAAAQRPPLHTSNSEIVESEVDFRVLQTNDSTNFVLQQDLNTPVLKSTSKWRELEDFGK